MGPNISLTFHKLFFPSGKIKSTPLSGGTLVWTWGQQGLRRSRLPTQILWQQWASSHPKWFCKVWPTWAGGSNVWQPSIMFSRIPFAHPETIYCIALGGTCDHGHLQWMQLPLRFKTSSEHQVSLVLYSDTFPEVVTGQLLLLRQEPCVILWPQRISSCWYS